MKKESSPNRSPVFQTFTIFLLVFQVNNLFAEMSSEFISKLNANKARFMKRHLPIIVMSTDDGYAEPTTVSIVSVKCSTSDKKSIIVLYNELSDENIKKLEGLSDKNTTIITQKIDEDILKKAEEFSTNWNILVQERIFYPEIFSKLNKNKKFLNKVGVNKIRYFVHLDSDTFVLRNLFDILGYIPENREVRYKSSDGAIRDIVETPCFASVPHVVFRQRLEKGMQWGGITGGVVVWDLDEIERTRINMVLTAKKIKARKLLYNNEHIFKIYNILIYSDKKEELVAKIKRIAEESKNLDDVIKTEVARSSNIESRDIKVFFENLSKIKKSFEDAEKLGEVTFQEFWGHLYNVATGTKTRKRIDFNLRRSSNRKKLNPNPTEEMVMKRFPQVFVSPRFNFCMRNIFPEIRVSSMSSLNKKNYLFILQRHLLQIPGIEDELIDNFKNMVVMHFDVSLKPWNLEFKELAKTNPSLQKIIDIYEIFKGGISDPDSTEDRSKKALELLEKIDPKTELQKVRNAIDGTLSSLKSKKFWEFWKK